MLVRSRARGRQSQRNQLQTWDGENGKILTGVLLGVMEFKVTTSISGDKVMRLRRCRIEGDVTPPGEMGISSPLLLLLSSCKVLPSRRNWWRSGLWLSSGRSKAARLHQPSMSWYQKWHFCLRQGWLDPPLEQCLLHIVTVGCCRIIPHPRGQALLSVQGQQERESQSRPLPSWMSLFLLWLSLCHSWGLDFPLNRSWLLMALHHCDGLS